MRYKIQRSENVVVYCVTYHLTPEIIVVTVVWTEMNADILLGA